MLLTAFLLIAAQLSSAVRLVADDSTAAEKEQSAVNAESLLRSQAARLVDLLRGSGSGRNATQLLHANIGQFRGALQGNLTDDELAPALLESVGEAVSIVNRRNFYHVALSSFAATARDSIPNSVTSRHTVKQRKVAVLVAFRYSGKGELNGTATDALNVWNVLTAGRKFQPEDIIVCTDDERVPLQRQSYNWFAGSDIRYLPGKEWTPAKLLRVLGEQAHPLQDGDFFVLHYAGHGGQLPDFTGKELDGKLEALIMPGGNLKDFEFYRFLTRLQQGVQVTIIADACHSQGFSNLPFNYNPGKAVMKGSSVEFIPERVWCCDWVEKDFELPKATIRFFSGSQNKQTSADFGQFLGGAFTRHLIDVWMGVAFMGRHASIQGDMKSLFNLFKQMLVRFREGTGLAAFEGRRTVLDQEPNFMAWPTVDDDEHFDIWAGTLRHGRAVGGDESALNTRMRAPPRCKESDNVPTKDIFRNLDHSFFGRDTFIEVNESLAPAQSRGGAVLEGWIAAETSLLFDKQGVVAVIKGGPESTMSEDSSPRNQEPPFNVWKMATKRAVEVPEKSEQPKSNVAVPEKSEQPKSNVAVPEKSEEPKSNVAKLAAEEAFKVPEKSEDVFLNLQMRFPGVADEKLIMLLGKHNDQEEKAAQELLQAGYQDVIELMQSIHTYDGDASEDDKTYDWSLSTADHSPLVSTLMKRFPAAPKSLIVELLEKHDFGIAAQELQHAGYYDVQNIYAVGDGTHEGDKANDMLSASQESPLVSILKKRFPDAPESLIVALLGEHDFGTAVQELLQAGYSDVHAAIHADLEDAIPDDKKDVVSTVQESILKRRFPDAPESFIVELLEKHEFENAAQELRRAGYSDVQHFDADIEDVH
eukprot:TRINITY_DN6530_c0_g1_i1.p1 TRINITY_DN6530_c0_g1~~TRINITY_DN6530_c0_g1_i1.p1  ORF type:complete len:871 (+),score=135.59 TRINITY_DN6530_c0_g1_i1:61-2673(+)